MNMLPKPTLLLQSIKPTSPKPNRMSSQPSSNLLPYRDINNHDVRYAPGVSPTTNNAGTVTVGLSYDSDYEPLIPNPHIVALQDLDQDSIMRFTATGRPMPEYRHSNLQNLGSDMYSVPQLLPKRYTDDSIIPAIVVDVIPSQKPAAEEVKKSKKGKFFGRLLAGDKQKDDISKGLTKVVFMPRRDYLKWFARGLQGEYIGSEPYKQWTEEELEVAFNQYKPAQEKKKKGYRPPF